MKTFNAFRAGMYGLLAGLLLLACNRDNDARPDGTSLRPSGAKPAWAPGIDPQMQAVLEQFLAFGTPPLPSLTPQQARMTPTMTDAVETLLKQNNIPATARAVSIRQRVIPGPAPEGLLVRIYTPTAVTGALPVVVYYHGGGWVIGSLDAYEPTCLALAEKAGAIVVSVDYRQAPEHKFPTAHEDAYAAYFWARNNATTFGGSAARVAVAGESAGGNLAAGVCLLAKERGFPQPVHQLLIYPIADNNLGTASYNAYANARPLSRPLMQWFFSNYLTNPGDGDNRLISLVDVADLRNVAPVTIISSEIDPLQTEVKLLFDKFVRLNVPVRYELYQGTTHEFLGTDAIVPDARSAQDLAAQRLRQAFGTQP